MVEKFLDKMTEEEKIEELYKFVYQNSDLENLEKYSNSLNIFECVGMVNQEIKHSNFLAWLFNPNGNHGLGDYFVKEFLKMILYNTRKYKELTIFDIDNWNLKSLEVIRERDNIDILFLDEINKFACVIENKIKSRQHSNQLENYIKKVEAKYGEKYKKMFVYMKPIEDEKINDSYIYVSYEDIIDLIRNLIDNKKEQLSDTLILVINNYKELLERNFMGKDKVKEICEQIYATHGNALRIIFDKVEDFKGGLDLCQIAVADSIKDSIKASNNYKLLCKDETVRNITLITKNLENYRVNLKFRIWNAIMNNDLALVIDFNNISDSKKEKICETFGINRKISKSQMRVSLGKILTASECKSCYDNFYKKNNSLSNEWSEKIFSNIQNKLSEDKLNKILEIMDETEC